MHAALHHAAHAGHTDVVAKLVIAGSPVQHADVKGRTAAHLAAVLGATEIVEKMLNAGYEVDMMGGACLGGGPLEQPHFHPPNTPEGSAVLHIAACHGHSKVTMQSCCELVHLSAWHQACAAATMRHGVVLHVLGMTWTCRQCTTRSLQITCTTLAGLADCEPLEAACPSMQHHLIIMLLQRPKLRARSMALQLVEKLLSVGADPKLKDCHGYTALHCAARGGYLPILELLLPVRLDAVPVPSMAMLHCCSGAISTCLDASCAAPISAVGLPKVTSLGGAELGGTTCR